MDTLTLNRWYTPLGTFGNIRMKRLVVWTVERPWRNNQKYISCIPEGVYEIAPSIFHKHNYPCYEILNVHNRSEIKIHIANFEDDVNGCIGIGSKLGAIYGRWAVLDSRRTFARFMRALDNQHYWLAIQRAAI